MLLHNVLYALLLGAGYAASAPGQRALLQGTAPDVAPAAAVTASPPGAAAAPAPGLSGPKADIVNIVEARAATFVNSSTLVLAGLSRSVQWVVDGSDTRRTGKIPVAKWFDKDFFKNGTWLASPAAVLHATMRGGNDTAVVLQLSAPAFNASANSLYFTYTPVISASQLALQAGAANSALTSPSTSAPQIGVVLKDVALFVDDALPVANPNAGNTQGGTKLGFEPLGGGRGFGGVNNQAGTTDARGGGGGGGLVNVGLGGCYYPGGFANSCYGYGYYGGAFGR